MKADTIAYIYGQAMHAPSNTTFGEIYYNFTTAIDSKL